ncbi:hypothetical protein HO133_004258 [Letharia lupina]|uniref:Uncharacterized protein n=1 Tax=Letharia lupina TaxID=560253 RepID=A0A8H6KZH5_9LECA|nr:uncharacterized protein HO133_004258 [Letharia lupina]KAF6229921.1 hypothetical protein HO133_004258 [Letharia lupina]
MAAVKDANGPQAMGDTLEVIAATFARRSDVDSCKMWMDQIASYMCVAMNSRNEELGKQLEKIVGVLKTLELNAKSRSNVLVARRRKQRPPPLASPIIASALHKHTALAVHLSAHKTFAVEKTVNFSNTDLTNFIEFTLSGLASFVYSLPLAQRIGRSQSMKLRLRFESLALFMRGYLVIQRLLLSEKLGVAGVEVLDRGLAAEEL